MDNNFFHRDFRILARICWRLRDFFLQGCQNCTLHFRKKLFEKESFLSETIRYKYTLGSFGHLEYLDGKCLFFEKKLNCFLTLILDPEKVCFGHLASFLCRFVPLALCLPRRTSSVKKNSSWNCFNNCVEWSVLGKKTFCKGTHNLTSFVRSWANQYWASGKKLGAGLLRVHSTGPVNLFPWKVFLKNVQFCNIFGFQVKHLRSFGENFLTVLSKLHSCCWKDFSEEK